MLQRWIQAVAAGAAMLALVGCAASCPVAMAPPVSPPLPAPGAAVPSGGGVFDWRQVPQAQQVPITRAVFDQGGYQLYAASGETIAVPFENQNLYAMKFGRSSNGSTYFVNQGDTPVLYLRNGDALENASAQGALVYPIPPDYQYTQPMYVALAPSWADWVGMGWYPGMVTYGGMWSYHPWASSFLWMPGFAINVGGSRYYNYNTYRSYTYTHPGYVRPRTTFNYSAARSTGSFGSSRFGSSSFGRSSSFGSSRFGNPTASTGSFGSARRSGSVGSFGGSSRSGSGSFGGASSSGFGRSSSSFGGSRSFGGSFSSPRPSGGSFGGSRSFGGSFGGGSRSFGGGGFSRRR